MNAINAECVLQKLSSVLSDNAFINDFLNLLVGFLLLNNDIPSISRSPFPFSLQSKHLDMLYRDVNATTLKSIGNIQISIK